MPNYNPNPTTRFATDRSESLTAKLTLRLAPSVMEELKKLENHQEFVRIAIAEKLARESEPQSGALSVA